MATIYSTSPGDAIVNGKLAHAIGYGQSEVRAVAAVFEKNVYTHVCRNGAWYTFDYQDPKTIWPIAERYNAFPWRIDTFQGHPATPIWAAYVYRGGDKWATITAPTAALAVARAVIEGANHG
jgi:hypothetical protein